MGLGSCRRFEMDDGDRVKAKFAATVGTVEVCFRSANILRPLLLQFAQINKEIAKKYSSIFSPWEYSSFDPSDFASRFVLHVALTTDDGLTVGWW